METENAFFEIYSKKIQGCSLPQAEIKTPQKSGAIYCQNVQYLSSQYSGIIPMKIFH